MERLWPALASGAVAVAIGLGVTYIISLAIEPPWDIGGVFLAVGLASFFAAFFSTLGAAHRG